jgi:hypothetical protein
METINVNGTNGTLDISGQVMQGLLRSELSNESVSFQSQIRQGQGTYGPVFVTIMLHSQQPLKAGRWLATLNVLIHKLLVRSPS